MHKLNIEDYMAKIVVELVKYDMDKTTKRKRKNLIVDAKTEAAIVSKLERIHKGEKLVAIHEVVWAEPVLDEDFEVESIRGTVKFFDDVKGFGFIDPDDDMDDLFFHKSALGGVKIHDGDIVRFEVSEGPKGPIAIKIQLMD